MDFEEGERKILSQLVREELHQRKRYFGVGKDLRTAVLLKLNKKLRKKKVKA